MTKKASSRVNFGIDEVNLPELNLIEVQRESWRDFVENGIKTEIAGISPVDDFTGKNWRLHLSNPFLAGENLTPRKAMEKGLTYASSLKINATLENKRTGESVSQEIYLGDIPQMTSVGTFVINGIERTVISQLVRSPGAYFLGDLDVQSGRILHTAELRPLVGTWLEFEVTRNDVIVARIDRRKKLPATVLLRAFGLDTNEKIMNVLGEFDKDQNHEYLKATLVKDNSTSREDALLDLYKKIRPGEPALLENATNLFYTMFSDPRRYSLGKVGRFKMNKRLGLTLSPDRANWVLTKDDVVAAMIYLLKLQNGEGKTDDIDHLGNRRLRRVGELVAVNAFRLGLLKLERSIKEKMSLISPDDKPTPSVLINARPLIASLNEFFRSNQLSTILDDTNPLSEIDNLRRVSVMGTGGINRDRASFSIRDVNASQYGRIDPVRSPEGPNIGLVTYLALYAKVDEYGFILSPYRKVEKVGKKAKVTSKVVYLTADDENEVKITHCGINIDKDGVITDTRVPIRFNGSFTEDFANEVDYIDVTPRQVFGTSASLIPFLPNDEGNRSLMGSNMQCQAVPLVRPSSPTVGTGMEKEIAPAMLRTLKSAVEGVVEWADAEKIVIKITKSLSPALLSSDVLEIDTKNKTATYFVTKFKKSSKTTCYNQTVVVKPGDQVKVGDVLADGPATEGGELALGRNLLVAYMCLDGYGFEDAILMSDRVVREDLLTSIHIEEYEADLVDTKLGPEELTRDIPNVSEGELANLAEDGIVVVGAEVGPNDILVGKIAPKGETELTSEERLLRAIFGEKAREVRDTSLRVPHGEKGVVVGISVLDRDQGDELGPGVIKRVTVKVAQIRKLTVGDKVAGRHGNKGVVAKIWPASDMPYLPDGTPIDIVISPLSVLARMNLGQLLECHLGWAMSRLNKKAAVPVFDKIPESAIVEALKEAKLPVNGKVRLVDGRSGEPFMEETVVGIGYILKLTHMVEDKAHARSTGPYSLVTQQPLGGKAQMGGQRLGEMEVWSLEAHKAAHTLQEMLTLKSDDIVGRARTFEAIVKGTEIPEAAVPESFKVLVRELNALGLCIEATGGVYSDEPAEVEVVTSAEAAEMKEVLGAKEVATSELTTDTSPMEVEEVKQ